MKKGTKTLLAGTGIAIAAAVGIGIAQAVTKDMVGEALDRREPAVLAKARNKLAGSVPHDDVLKLADELGEELACVASETVEIESFDGTKLRGHVYRAPEAKRFIIAMHGWRSAWNRDYSVIWKFWHENDCSVLYVEQRGQGESEGEYMGFGLLERFDCIEWIKWLNENGGAGLPVYLAGISMGATTVLMASGSGDMPENVRGIMADCGFTSPREIWRHVAEDNLKINFGILQKQVDLLCKKRLDMESDAYSTIDAMAVNKIPVLFIHGSADHFVPVEMTCENYGACRAPKRLVIVNNAEHGMSYIVDRETYEKAVLDFFAEFDAATDENAES